MTCDAVFATSLFVERPSSVRHREPGVQIGGRTNATTRSDTVNTLLVEASADWVRYTIAQMDISRSNGTKRRFVCEPRRARLETDPKIERTQLQPYLCNRRDQQTAGGQRTAADRYPPPLLSRGRSDNPDDS